MDMPRTLRYSLASLRELIVSGGLVYPQAKPAPAGGQV